MQRSEIRGKLARAGFPGGRRPVSPDSISFHPGYACWTDPTNDQERRQVLAALARVGRWVNIDYGWRPNLPDEAGNHLVELAIAGGATAIITHNVRDIRRGELLLSGLQVHTPADYLEKTR